MIPPMSRLAFIPLTLALAACLYASSGALAAPPGEEGSPPGATPPPSTETPPTETPPEKEGSRPKAPDLAPSATEATIADLRVPTRVRSRPSASAKAGEIVHTAADWNGGPMRLLVLDSALDSRERLWVQVRLHTRPNDSAGWIPANRVDLERTRWRIVLRLRPRKITVYHAGKAKRRFRAVIGAEATPTPLGLFAIAEEVPQGSPDTFLGPWALHLTAHSNVLFNFGGGPGRVAIHGRGGTSLLDPLGTAASHGCIRVDNVDINWLVNRVTPGVPVVVKR